MGHWHASIHSYPRRKLDGSARHESAPAVHDWKAGILPGNRAVAGPSDLVQWTMIAVRTNQTGTVEFTDSAAANVPQRFYRVLVP